MNKPIFRLDKKVAVITGGASGIGESICRLFATQGAIVFILDVNVEDGEKLSTQLQSEGFDASFIFCDVTNLERVSVVFQEIYNQKKAFDILIPNAGIAQIGNVEATTPDNFDKIYKVNVLAVYHCLLEGIKLMRINNVGGVVLNLASVASVIGLSDRFAYMMSKGAVLSMTYSLAKDYIKHNIRCNAIGPGRVHTPFVDSYLKNNFPGQEEEMFEKLEATQPIGRMASPDEIAYLALYLCSDEASFVTGSFYPIDGGFITLNS